MSASLLFLIPCLPLYLRVLLWRSVNLGAPSIFFLLIEYKEQKISNKIYDCNA